MDKNEEKRIKKNELYKYRSENGLCTQCGKPLDTTGKVCSSCREKRNAQVRINYAYKKMNGHCTRCGAETLPGSATCEVCKVKDAERHKENYEKVRDKNRIRSADRKKRLKEQNRCSHCGKPLEEEGYAYCAECRLKQRKYNAERRAGKGKMPGVCLYCNKPAAKGYSYCEEHLEKKRESIAYARKFTNRDLIRKYLDADANKAKWEKGKL